jgi:hypothetical protein
VRTDLLKDFVPGVIIVLAGLCGMFLDPTQPPLVGGRTALIILAMLLSVDLSEAGARRQVLMWTDILLGVQVLILLCGLIET